MDKELIAFLVKNKEKGTALHYQEPVEGFDEDGNDVTVNLIITISVKDAINRQRLTTLRKNRDLSEEILLDDFIINNYAMIL